MPNAVTQPTKVIAPATMLDRSPVVIGQGLSLAYVASCFRQALNGYRQNYVDLLSELIEQDPHASCVIGQRALTVAGGRIHVTPATLAQDDPRQELAEEISEHVRAQIDGLSMRSQTLSQLMWGVYWGLSGGENQWKLGDDGKWTIARISFIHSRRLSYPDPGAWDVYIVDQGGMGSIFDTMPTSSGLAPGSRGVKPTYGLRVADLPGKFVVHAPQLRSEYPTRDGIGRVVGTYLALKRMVMRATAQDFELSIKPKIIGYFRTADDQDKGRPANDADIATANAAAQAMATGSFASAMVPDTVKLEILRSASTMSQGEFIDYLDACVTQAARGQTFTTSTGKYGSRATSDTGRKIELLLARYDAECLCDTLERDVVTWIVRMNYPGCEALIPKLKILVEDAPDPAIFTANLDVFVKSGAPVDADAAAQIAGIPLIPNETGEPRELKKAEPPAPGAPPTPPEPGEEPGTQEVTDTSAPANDGEGTPEERQQDQAAE